MTQMVSRRDSGTSQLELSLLPQRASPYPLSPVVRPTTQLICRATWFRSLIPVPKPAWERFEATPQASGAPILVRIWCCVSNSCYGTAGRRERLYERILLRGLPEAEVSERLSRRSHSSRSAQVAPSSCARSCARPKAIHSFHVMLVT